jgi:dUTP pyrophosphatase
MFNNKKQKEKLKQIKEDKVYDEIAKKVEGLSMEEMKLAIDDRDSTIGVWGKSACIFEKVDFEQFKKDIQNIMSGLSEENIRTIYDDIKLPKRGTNGSAGYDFFAPFGFDLDQEQSIIIPTGIKAYIKPDTFLACVPRSGSGFKYKLQLANTIGIIDADYVVANNNGHIMLKLVYNGFYNNDRSVNISFKINENEKCNKNVTLQKEKEGIFNIEQGQAFAQGILMQYSLSQEDLYSIRPSQRTGGFGSTDKK